jgi:hypothetical protein
VKELTSADILGLGPMLRRFLPVAVKEIWLMGSGSVAAIHSDIPAALRNSRDVDVVPIGVPVLQIDALIMERELGEDSVFASEHMFFVDYVTPDLLRCTPPGWQDRVTILNLAPGLNGHCLDPHDVAYNKLWAGRPKDIIWVHGLLGTGIITRMRLEELHASNPISTEDRARVERSLEAVRNLGG